MLTPRHHRHIQRPTAAVSACEALVEFFSHSQAAAGIIRLLATKTQPVAYKHLMDELRLDRSWQVGHLPPGAIRAALRITLAAGLVRMTELGFSITDVGRDVQTCVELRAKLPTSEASEDQTFRATPLRGRLQTSPSLRRTDEIHQSTFFTERND